MNVFRRCLKQEFGNSDYDRYVLMCHEELRTKNPSEEIKMSEKSIYRDMCEHLQDKKPYELKKKREILSDTLVEAFQIARQFGFVFVFYLAGSLAVILMELHPVVTNVSLVLMGVCFLYKTYEFVCNKFCFVDAYLVMVYKTALEHALH